MHQYFVDSTLINYHLINLSKLYFNPLPPELGRNQNIRVRLYTDKQHPHDFDKCHIDDTINRRLYLPIEIISWIRCTFAFSVAYYASNGKPLRNRDIEIFNKAIHKQKNKKTGNPIRMDIPGETILISWEKDENGFYLAIKKGFQITADNAVDVLSKKAIASVLPYILATVKGTSLAATKTDGKKSDIIDRTTDWLPAKEYAKIQFSHPGIYLLRRKDDTNGYSYYIGKASDISKRVIQSGNTVSHPDQKGESNKQYDEIACTAVKFDDYIRLFGKESENYATPKNNPGVKRGSITDIALYAIEDLAIHIAAMLLRSEGKTLDNIQYRSYTSEWIKKL